MAIFASSLLVELVAAQELCRSAEVTRLCSGKLTHYLEKKNGCMFLFSK
jgi:hypothetical protein